MTLTIGVDVGGTKVAAGVVDEDGTVLQKVRRSTPASDVRATEKMIADLVAELRREHDVTAVGIGAAGYIDAARSTVMFAPNLAWRDEPLREAVERLTGVPVAVENDANAAAWGEFRYGAAHDVDDSLMVALGTGIGGGIVIDGALFRGTFGVAGEFGHIRMVPDGRLCGCGNYGCWEQYASGTALVRDVRASLEAGSGDAAGLLERAGGDPEAIDGPMITAAAQDGDRLAVQAFQTLGNWLGEGISDLVSIFDPGVIVIGGGVSEAGDVLLEAAYAGFRRLLSGRGHRPEAELRLARLGNEAGLIGAADLARVTPPS